MRNKVVAALLAFCLGACGAAADGRERVAAPATGEADVTVQVIDLAFSPATTEIRAGGTVAWSWDRARAEHDVAFDDAPASPLQRSGTWQRTFDRPGTYDYICTLHGNMKGRVVVSPS